MEFCKIQKYRKKNTKKKKNDKNHNLVTKRKITCQLRSKNYTSSRNPPSRKQFNMVFHTIWLLLIHT